MADRKQFVGKLKARLDEWDAQIDELEAKAKGAEASARSRYEDEVADVRRRAREARSTLTKLRDAGDDAWKELRDGAEESWNALQRALENATSRISEVQRR